MLKLRDIMTRDVITMTPAVSLREAMELFADRHISGAPVVDGRKVVGVISTTDLMAYAAAMADADGEGALDDPTVDNEGGESWSWDDESGPAAAYFTGSWDQDAESVTARFELADHPSLGVLDIRTVAEAMTRRVCSLPSTASVTEAADHMRRSAIHRMLVIDGEELMGLVSTMDITKAVADHRLVSRTYVFGEAGAQGGSEHRHSQLGARLPNAH